MIEPVSDEKAKAERSPSYPFISLRKAEERTKQFWEKHRREAARIASVGSTWGYRAKSSGLQQTVGALKQYGLLEDIGAGVDRKIQLTDLGRRLVADQREGARQSALREAALRPRLFQEYSRWINEMPSESHCLSELELDRGFNAAAAQTFLKAFTDTIVHAGLREGEGFSPSLGIDSDEVEEAVSPGDAAPPRHATARRASPWARVLSAGADTFNGSSALSDRLNVQVTVGSLSITALLCNEAEVDAAIRILEANKILLKLGTS